MSLILDGTAGLTFNNSTVLGLTQDEVKALVG
jgi:hypothetical protein